MSKILKSVIQDIINDNTESAQMSMHSYIVAKTQEVSGLTEGAAGAAQKFIIIDERHWDEDEDGEFSMFDIYVVELSELKGMDTESQKFIRALKSGKIGKKSGKGRVFSIDPDLGCEGFKGPAGVKLLFTER